MPESLFNWLHLWKCTQIAHQAMGEHVKMTTNFCCALGEKMALDNGKHKSKMVHKNYLNVQ